MPFFWSYLFVFLIGSIIGSFLNVVVLRSEKNENYLRGRSYCPYCQKLFLGWQLIPVFSFFYFEKEVLLLQTQDFLAIPDS